MGVQQDLNVRLKPACGMLVGWRDLPKGEIHIPSDHLGHTGIGRQAEEHFHVAISGALGGAGTRETIWVVIAPL